MHRPKIGQKRILKKKFPKGRLSFVRLEFSLCSLWVWRKYEQGTKRWVRRDEGTERREFRGEWEKKQHPSMMKKQTEQEGSSHRQTLGQVCQWETPETFPKSWWKGQGEEHHQREKGKKTDFQKVIRFLKEKLPQCGPSPSSHFCTAAVDSLGISNPFNFSWRVEFPSGITFFSVKNFI